MARGRWPDCRGDRQGKRFRLSGRVSVLRCNRCVARMPLDVAAVPGVCPLVRPLCRASASGVIAGALVSGAAPRCGCAGERSAGLSTAPAWFCGRRFDRLSVSIDVSFG